MPISRGAGFTGAKSSSTAEEELGAPKVSIAQIDFGADVSGKLGDAGAFHSAMLAVSERATIFKIGPLAASDQKVSFIYEDIGQTAAEFQTALQALGTVDGVDFSGQTVTLKDLNDRLDN